MGRFLPSLGRWANARGGVFQIKVESVFQLLVQKPICFDILMDGPVCAKSWFGNFLGLGALVSVRCVSVQRLVSSELLVQCIRSLGAWGIVV